MSTEKTGFDWWSFLLGILFIIVSLIAFRDPSSTLESLVIVFGIIAVVKGIFELFFRRRLRQYTGWATTMPVVMGVFDIIIGLLLLFNVGAGMVAISVIFALWFLIDSIVGLFTASSVKAAGEGYYWFTIIVCILGVIVGIMLLLSPATAGLTLSFLVGFYFMLFGITEITYAFR